MLGSIYLRRGELGPAQVELRQSIHYQPTFALAHYNLALVLEKHGQEDEAEEELKTALKLDPRFTAARRKLNALGTYPH